LVQPQSLSGRLAPSTGSQISILPPSITTPTELPRIAVAFNRKHNVQEEDPYISGQVEVQYFISTVTPAYGLYGREVGVRVLVRARFSPFHVFQTGSGVHPSFSAMGTEGSLPWAKRQGRETDHSPPTSAEIKNIWICTSTTLRLHGGAKLVMYRDNLTFTFAVFHLPTAVMKITAGIHMKLIKEMYDTL
jgi:hypothetical protein